MDNRTPAQYSQDPRAVRMRAYRQKNRERLLAKRRSDYALRPEMRVKRDPAYAKAYTDRNRAVIRERYRLWCIANPDKAALYGKRWRQANRARVAERAMRHESRKKGNAVALITAKDLRRILREPCVYCGGKAVEMDHVIPVSRGGRHSIGNLAGACLYCNRSKGGSLVVEWKRRRPDLFGG